MASGFVPKALVTLEQSPGKPVEKLLVKLLTNLTTSDEGALEVLSTEKQKSGSWLVFQSKVYKLLVISEIAPQTAPLQKVIQWA